MRAITLTDNDFDHLTLQHIDDPTCAADEVIVKLHASALNHRDVWIVQGQYPQIQLPAILGSDGAGTVCEVGSQVPSQWLQRDVIINPSLEWGDDPHAQANTFHILGMPSQGTQANYIAIKPSQLIEKPSHLSMTQAAALPLAGLTAYHALFTQGQLQPHHTLLIPGIGGGVATMLLAFASHTGARVIVTSSSQHKLDYALQHGAIAAINYRDPDWITQVATVTKPHGIDLIIDSVGGDNMNAYLDLIRVGGCIVNYGATRGAMSQVNLAKLFFRQVRLQGSTMGSPTDFTAMCHFVECYQIIPTIHQCLSWEKFKQAYTTLKDGQQLGKIVLTHD